MAIRETIIVDIAEVQVTDELRVELRQEKKRTTYTARQARDLALELIHAAERLEHEFEVDLTERGIRLADEQIRDDHGRVIL